MSVETEPFVYIPYSHQSIVPENTRELLFPDFDNANPPEPNIPRLVNECFEKDGIDYALASMGETGLIVGVSVASAITRELRLSATSPHPPETGLARIEKLTNAMARFQFAVMVLDNARGVDMARYTEPYEDGQGFINRRVIASEYSDLRERTRDIDDQPTLRLIMKLKEYRQLGIAEAQRAQAERLLRILYDNA